LLAVGGQKSVGGHEANPFVAIQKRMVFHQAVRIGSGEVEQVGLTIIKNLLRAALCRIRELIALHEAVSKGF
jgi:hypothetical protein